MLCYWWLYPIAAPVVALDIIMRACPIFRGLSPVGLEYLAKDY